MPPQFGCSEVIRVFTLMISRLCAEVTHCASDRMVGHSEVSFLEGIIYLAGLSPNHSRGICCGF